MQYDDLLQLVKTRRSIRRFKPDPVPDEDITKILEVARWAMSGANGQPWEFVVVKDAETRKKILDIYSANRELGHEIEKTRLPELWQPVAAAPLGKPPTFKDAPVIIVIAGDPRTVQATVLAAHFTGVGATVFVENLTTTTLLIHLAAASLGLGAQWVSISHAYEGSLKALLGIPEIYQILTIVPIGYPAFKPATIYRRELKEMTHWDSYDKARYRSPAEVIAYIARLRKLTKPGYDV